MFGDRFRTLGGGNGVEEPGSIPIGLSLPLILLSAAEGAFVPWSETAAPAPHFVPSTVPLAPEVCLIRL